MTTLYCEHEDCRAPAEFARHCFIHAMSPLTPPTTWRGVYYFATYRRARDHALADGLPTNRIIRYGRGWAIQLRVSGPYAGPENDR